MADHQGLSKQRLLSRRSIYTFLSSIIVIASMEESRSTLQSTLESQSLRQRIKRATQSIHDKLDTDPAGLKLMSPDANRSDYAFFLARTLGFLKPIEAKLLSSEVATLALPYWRSTEIRSPRIESDLRSLGVSQGEIDSLPTTERTPNIVTAGHLMGVSYVIEGSMMGGLVMAKPVRKTLELDPTSMSFFLPSEPKEIVKKFESFAEALDSFAKCDCDEKEAMEAATETFRLIESWFQGSSTPRFNID
jgi:heme oxygenase (biliverdin-IX-beta and delta-forming)